MDHWKKRPVVNGVIMVTLVTLCLARGVVTKNHTTRAQSGNVNHVDHDALIQGATVKWFGVCPVGSQRDQQSGHCIEICNDSSPKNLSRTGDPTTWINVQGPCIASSNDTYELTTATIDPTVRYDEPIADLRLPACKRVTLHRGEFRPVPNSTMVQVLLGTVSINVEPLSKPIDGGNRTSDRPTGGTTVDLCYPLSPQLLQCTLKRLHPDLYTILPKGFLQNRQTGDQIDFRDYFSTETGDVLGCTVPIGPGRKLRCNYIQFQKGEYEFVRNGTAVRLPVTGSEIYLPEYSVLEHDAIELCYPFSPKMTTCKIWLFEKHEFEIRSDKTLRRFVNKAIYDPGDYLLRADGRAGVCSERQPPLPAVYQVRMTIASLQVVSAVCLFVAFVIHILIPRLNYHAKPLLCHMFVMVVMYCSLAFRSFKPRWEGTPCYVVFVFNYYSVMAAFFWLNVLAFELWTIFANLQTTSTFWCSCGARTKGNRRFYYYSLYAWGLPLLFITAAVLLDTQEPLQELFQMRPNVRFMCWFNERKSSFLLLYGPLLCVLGINLLLFVLTVYNLHHASKGVEVVNKDFNKQLLLVCFKIFVVMGLCWITEAVAFTLSYKGEGTYATDFLNAIQGVIIFVIYICKPATYKLLREKFCGRRPSDGKWTTDFNMSNKSHTERQTSTSGVSMNSIHVVSKQSSTKSLKICNSA